MMRRAVDTEDKQTRQASILRAARALFKRNDGNRSPHSDKPEDRSCQSLRHHPYTFSRTSRVWFATPRALGEAAEFRLPARLGANRPVRGPVVRRVRDRFRRRDGGFPRHAPSSLLKSLLSPPEWRLLGALYFRLSLVSMTYSFTASL